jgi:hypothetical protein
LVLDFACLEKYDESVPDNRRDIFDSAKIGTFSRREADEAVHAVLRGLSEKGGPALHSRHRDKASVVVISSSGSKKK